MMMLTMMIMMMTKNRESRMASQTRSPVKVGFIFSLLRGRVHQYCNGTLLWQIQVVNIVRKQNTWRWRAEGRGYCQGSPGRQWRGWRHHWCRTPTASPPRRRPSGPITAAQVHIPTDAELKVRLNFLGITVNWSCLTFVTWIIGSYQLEIRLKLPLASPVKLYLRVTYLSIRGIHTCEDQLPPSAKWADFGV